LFFFFFSRFFLAFEEVAAVVGAGWSSVAFAAALDAD